MIELVQKIALWAPAIVFILSFGAVLWVTAYSRESERVKSNVELKAAKDGAGQRLGRGEEIERN